MLDGLLGRSFSSKCKSLIKLTKSRIDVIRRKRNATQKFLKKDIADLLTNGLDINAYGRTEGLLAELNVSFCYDFVEESGNFVLKQLSVMQKQRDCPEDCREAVSSLMFAAARFSDLPELRDLRQIFQERYGNSLEYFVNQELVEKLASKPATMDKKVQLMQDIASEFSITWDSRAFQQRMSKPSASPQEQPKSYGSFKASNEKYKSINGKDTIPNEEKHDISYKDRHERTSVGHILQNGKEGNVSKRNELIQPLGRVLSNDGYKSHDGREGSILKVDYHDISHQGRQEVSNGRVLSSDGYKPHTVREGSILKVDYHDISHQGRQEVSNGKLGRVLSSDGYKPHSVREGSTPKVDYHDISRQGRQEINGGKHGRVLSSGDGYRPHSDREGSIPKVDYRDISLQRREEVIDGKHKYWNGKEDIAQKTVRVGSSSHGEIMEYANGAFKPYGGRENDVPKRESKDKIPYGDPYIVPSCAAQHLGSSTKSDGKNLLVGQHNNANSTKNVQEDEIPKLKPYYNNVLPPPYVKPNVKSKDSKHGASLGSSHLGSDGIAVPNDPSVLIRANAGERSERIPVGLDHGEHERPIIGITGVDEVGKDRHYKDDFADNPIPKPRSVRRRHHKSLSGASDDVGGNVGDVGVVKRKSRSRRKDDSRRGLQILFDDDHYQNNEEERIMDKLLMHYSKKPTTYEQGMIRRKSKSRHGHRGVSDAPGEAPQPLNRDVSDDLSEIVPPPPRSLSLPHQQTAPSEATKVFARAASFQPDRSSAAKHVHPKLPDYDNLAAQFAAMKGR